MREIKFRAWIPKLSRIFENAVTQRISGTLNPIINTYFDGEIILMQYTGLKDKNGTEIYEGDIVRFCNDENPFEVYQHASGDWQAGGHSIWEWMDESENNWEVVGNIYENPELLKRD